MTPPTTSSQRPNGTTASYQVGDLVQVLPRTWAGINKPGGAGRVTRVHYSAGFLESVDISYVIGAQKDKNVDLEYVKPHIELERVSRSRRGRDFFKASPGRGVTRRATRQQAPGKPPASSSRAVATSRRSHSSKRRKVSMTAATRHPSRVSSEDQNKQDIMMVDVEESEACGVTPPKFAALAEVPVLEIEVPIELKQSDCVSPMDIADRFMRVGSFDDEEYEPYTLDDVQTDQICPCPSPRELLARHEKHAEAHSHGQQTSDPTRASTGAKRSLYAATVKRSKSSDETSEDGEDDRKPSPTRTDRKSLARSQSDSKLPASLRVSQSAKSRRRKSSNMIRTPSARRILPLQKYRQKTAQPVTQSPADDAPKRRKPLQQIFQNRVEGAQKFVRSVVCSSRASEEFEPDPPKSTIDPSRLELFRNNLSKLWEGGDEEILEKDQIILDLNTHLMAKSITARIFTQSEIDGCLRTLEDEGILMLGAADQHVYRI